MRRFALKRSKLYSRAESGSPKAKFINYFAILSERVGRQTSAEPGACGNHPRGDLCLSV